MFVAKPTGGDVDGSADPVSDIEARVGERHRQRSALLEGDPAFEPDGAGQDPRHLAKLRGQIDAGDPPAEAAAMGAGVGGSLSQRSAAPAESAIMTNGSASGRRRMRGLPG